MKWSLKQGSILDEPADVLICSANVHLTLSGGVGAELLGRYGNQLQTALVDFLRQKNVRWLNRGEIVPYTGTEIPHKAVLHAVAVDGWYESSPAIIEDLVRRCLQMAAQQFGARKVTLTALATGFGHLTLAQFGEGVRPLAREHFDPIEEVCIVLLEDYRLAELAAALPEALPHPVRPL